MVFKKLLKNNEINLVTLEAVDWNLLMRELKDWAELWALRGSVTA